MVGSGEGLTQILPVSIPNDNLLVSGLKDMQEHCAEDKIPRTAVTILWLFVMKIPIITSFHAQHELNKLHH